MREVVRRGLVNCVASVGGQHIVFVAWKTRPGEGTSDWICHAVGCSETEAALFREGQPVTLALELDPS